MMMLLAGTLPSRGELIGSAYGVLILDGFAALWAVLAAYALGKLGKSSWILILLITALLGWGGIHRLNVGRTLPPDSPAVVHSESSSGWQRSFEIVLTFEWVPIIAVVVIFNRMKRPHLIAPAIAIVVGLHFLPLAQIFGFRIYYATGAAMIAAGLLPIPIQSIGTRKATTCGSCAVILWITAALMLR